jgi:hypothetical protein
LLCELAVGCSVAAMVKPAGWGDTVRYGFSESDQAFFQ